MLNLVFSSLIMSSLTTVGYAQAIQSTSEYQSAMQALGSSNFDKAYDSLSPLIQDGRHRAAAMVEMGRIRQKQAESEMSKALSHYNEAAELMSGGIQDKGITGSEIPKALYDLGRIYEEKLKNYDEAHGIYSRIIDEYPNYLAIDKVYYNLASCEELMGMFDEAAAHYQKVVSDYSYSSYFEAAQEKCRKLAPGTAVEEKAIASAEDYAEEKSETSEGARAALDLGDMQAKSGKYKLAAEAYRKAIGEATDTEEAVEAYRKLVDMLDNQQKDHKGAAAAIEEMMAAYPNAQGTEDLVYRLGQIYETDLDSMKKKVIDGQVRYRKSDENSRKALEYYDSVTDKYPESQVAADAWQRKGKIYEELKEYDEAREAYEQFIKYFPQHKDAPEIRQKLKDMEGY